MNFMRKISVSFIVSTMNRSDISFIDKIFSEININDFKHEIIVVNQSKAKRIKTNNDNIIVINTSETGLSKSRNLGLVSAKNDIIQFLDDDVIIKKTSLKAYEYLIKSDLSILTGIILNYTNLPVKKYRSNLFSHNFFSIMKVSAMECIFKREVFSKGIKFNEDFGLGSKKHQTGEENIILSDCLKSNFIIKFIPIPMLLHNDVDRDKNKYFNIDIMKANGAVFSNIYGKFLSIIISFFWLLKKIIFTNYDNKLFFKSYSLMINGILKR